MRLRYARKHHYPRPGYTLHYDAHDLSLRYHTSTAPPKILFFEILSTRPGRAGFCLDLNDAEARHLADALQDAIAQTKGPQPCRTRSAPNKSAAPLPTSSKAAPSASSAVPTSKRCCKKYSKRSTPG